MVVKVLQLLAVLVKFGYYDDNNHVKDLLPSIFKLLNGKEDYPTKKTKDIIQSGGIGQDQRIMILNSNQYTQFLV